MSEVLLDGESVTFSGPPPASIAEVRGLLEQVLAGRGRVLAGLWIDSQPFDENHGTVAMTSVGRVEGRSMSLAEALEQVGAELRPELAAVGQAVRTFACDVLREPWSEAQARALRLLEAAAAALQRAVDVAALSGEESPTTQAVSALATTVEHWMAAIQAQDAARVALLLDGEVGPALARVAAALPGGSEA